MEIKRQGALALWKEVAGALVREAAHKQSRAGTRRLDPAASMGKASTPGSGSFKSRTPTPGLLTPESAMRPRRSTAWLSSLISVTCL